MDDHRDWDFQDFLDKRREEQRERWNDLEEEYKNKFMEFTIESYEMKSLDEWTSEHSKNCRKRSYSYRFTPTGIGMGVSVECACGASENITDYESW
ncbi:MAG: hypothetical protein ACXADH_12805 [Candidatus Kariarchaeaceae archaeon]|jgi:hypothetical protein